MQAPENPISSKENLLPWLRPFGGHPALGNVSLFYLAFFFNLISLVAGEVRNFEIIANL